MTGAIDNAKRALRAELRERRQQRTDAVRAAEAQGIREQLDALIAGLGARSVSCYLSSPTEPGTHEFIIEAVRRGIRVLLPITRNDGLLDWTVATEDGDIIEGLFGMPELDGEVLSPVAVNDVDVLLIPAAAVDRTGMRLGWGRGYFDKTIGSMERCPPVYAIILDSEFVDDVPSEIHDQPVDGIVTPTRTLLLAPHRR